MSPVRPLNWNHLPAPLSAKRALTRSDSRRDFLVDVSDRQKSASETRRCSSCGDSSVAPDCSSAELSTPI
jgi:hypothetical protein